MFIQMNVRKARRLSDGLLYAIRKSSIFKVIVLVFLLQAPLKIMYAQTPVSAVKPLTVGDTMPDVVIGNMVNYGKKELRLSDLKDKKITILDFWSTKCGSCVAKFPLLDTLQAKYKKDLQVLLINSNSSKETNEVVDKFFRKRAQDFNYKVTLPYSVGDAVLEKYLPFRYLPHIVWLNQDRKIIAITSGIELNEDNLVAMLDKKALKIRHKADDPDYDYTKPLFTNGNDIAGDAIKYRSTLTGYLEGVGFISGGFQMNPDGTSRYSAINTFLSQIYRELFDVVSYPSHSVIFESRKTELFSPRLVEGKEYDNLYTYELIMKASSEDELKRNAQDELKKYFKVTVNKEKRVRDVYVLNYGKALNNDFSLSQPIKNNNPNKNDFAVSTSELLQILNMVFDKAVITDIKRTGNTVYLPKNYDTMDQKQIETLLNELGFTIARTRRMVDVLVYKDI